VGPEDVAEEVQFAAEESQSVAAEPVVEQNQVAVVALAAEGSQFVVEAGTAGSFAVQIERLIAGEEVEKRRTGLLPLAVVVAGESV
jgi:hypothetical protein